MATSTPDSAEPARRRSLPLVVLDITAGVLITGFGLVLAFGVIVTALSVSENNRVENASLLSTIVTSMVALTIFGWAIPSGMFLVRLIQRRYAFYWPIIGIIIVLLTLYIGSAIIGTLPVSA